MFLPGDCQALQDLVEFCRLCAHRHFESSWDSVAFLENTFSPPLTKFNWTRAPGDQLMQIWFAVDLKAKCTSHFSLNDGWYLIATRLRKSMCGLKSSQMSTPLPCSTASADLLRDPFLLASRLFQLPCVPKMEWAVSKGCLVPAMHLSRVLKLM